MRFYEPDPSTNPGSPRELEAVYDRAVFPRWRGAPYATAPAISRPIFNE